MKAVVYFQDDEVQRLFKQAMESEGPFLKDLIKKAGVEAKEERDNEQKPESPPEPEFSFEKPVVVEKTEEQKFREVLLKRSEIKAFLKIGEKNYTDAMKNGTLQYVRKGATGNRKVERGELIDKEPEIDRQCRMGFDKVFKPGGESYVPTDNNA